MIKAIIFDYGNVISKVDNAGFLEEISKETGKTGAEIDRLIKEGEDHLMKFETGLISPDQFFERVIISGGLEIEQDDFLRLFTRRFTPITGTRDLMKRLKPGHKLGLLSNTNAWDYEYEITRCDVFGLFDTVSVSFRVGAMKPDRKIYLDALEKLGAAPEECVYIDDIKEYAGAATALGIHGIHYISHEELVRSLRELQCVL